MFCLWSRWSFFANCWCFKTHCVVSLVEVVEGKDEEDGAGDHPREGWGQVRVGVGVGGQGRVQVGLPPYMSSHQFSTLTHCCWPPCKVRNTLRGNTNTQIQIKWDQIQKHKHWHTAGLSLNKSWRRIVHQLTRPAILSILTIYNGTKQLIESKWARECTEIGNERLKGPHDLTTIKEDAILYLSIWSAQLE